MNIDIEYHSDFFKRAELYALLTPIVNKTFKDIDSHELFEKLNAPNANLNKGVFGNVIEQSVLGMAPNPKAVPDITVDYTDTNEAFRGVIKTEIKTTGMVKNTKNKLVPKERVSVTAVSIGNIEDETWDTSHYREKISHILWIFYLYEFNGSRKNKFSPYEQRKFRILNFGFQHLTDDPTEMLKFKHDWTVIHDYLVLHRNDADRETNWYPMLHQNTKAQLIYTDIAPRYPNRPRLAFKNSYVATVYDILFKSSKYDKLNFSFTSMDELNERLHDIASRYAGKTVQMICDSFGIKVAEKKNFVEPMIIRMFDSDFKKLNKIDVFCKAGIILKTFTFSNKGRRTEDTKLFPMNVKEFSDKDISYYDTEYYDFFNNKRALYIIFQEESNEQPNAQHKFLGFKWYDYTDVQDDCKRCWGVIRDRIINKTLKNETSRMRNGKPIYAPNFPKSSEMNIFVRGTSTADIGKNWNINGVKMYKQDIWIKGTYLAEKLREIPYI